MLPLVLLVGVVHSIWRLVGIICRHGVLGEQSLISKMTFAFRFAVFRFFLAGHPLARTLPERTAACAVEAKQTGYIFGIETHNYISKPGLAVMISV